MTHANVFRQQQQTPRGGLRALLGSVCFEIKLERKIDYTKGFAGGEGRGARINRHWVRQALRQVRGQGLWWDRELSTVAHSLPTIHYRAPGRSFLTWSEIHWGQTLAWPAGLDWQVGFRSHPDVLTT